jgi:hypothetical protein
MGLLDIIKGSRTVNGTPNVQPNPVTFGTVSHRLGHEARDAYLQNRFTDKLMIISPVGFSEERPTTIYGTPSAIPYYGSSAPKTNDSPTKGSCNK